MKNSNLAVLKRWGFVVPQDLCQEVVNLRLTRYGVQFKIMWYITVFEDGSETAPAHESKCAI